MTGSRRGAVVLGSPIAHSLSPVLHGAAYAQLGLPEWSYDAVECGPAELEATLHRLDDAGLAGASLTMPLKRAVIPLLARCERLASDVGAVNTVVFGGVPGEWWGANTDVPGFTAALREVGVARLVDARVLLVGAGATAAAAVAAVAELGAHEVRVVARRPAAVERLDEIARGFGVDVIATQNADAVVEADLVIATLPAGAADPLAGQIDDGVRGILFDVVYAGWPTPLARAWSAGGGRVIGGLELLVHQAVEQVRLMTGREPDAAAMRAAGQRALAGATGGIH
jgi:shikimate dehydrogenase